MRKLLFVLSLILVIVTSAFIIKPRKAPAEKKQVSLYWFVGGNYTGRQNTKANEIGPSGCPNTGLVHCEDGYDANDFVTVGDPWSGLKSGATINEFIPKP